MLQQLNLFEVTPVQLPKPPKGSRCKDCKHMTRNYYNSNIKYCSKQRSPRTGTGWKKIKANNSAVNCPFFEPKNTNTAKLFIQ